MRCSHFSECSQCQEAVAKIYGGTSETSLLLLAKVKEREEEIATLLAINSELMADNVELMANEYNVYEDW